MKKVLQLTGLDCAHCAAQLEREISKLEGVHFASLVFVSQKLTVEYENEEALDRVIRHANAFEEVRVIEKDNEESKPTHKKELISLAFSAIALIVCGVLFQFASDMLFMKIAKYVVFAVLYAFVAYPVLISTVKIFTNGSLRCTSPKSVHSIIQIPHVTTKGFCPISRVQLRCLKWCRKLV